MLYFATFFAFALPIIAMVIWKKKTGVGIAPFAVGAMCFMLFAMGLEQILHGICLSGTNALSEKIIGTPWLYVTYGCLAAGIFEETGRLFGFKLLLHNQKGKEVSVAYGIGHGGIESILTLGLTYVILSLASLGISMGDANIDAQMQTSLRELTTGSMCLAMLERLTALLLQIGLSILVFAAAHRPGKKLYFPLAIILHALTDVVVGMYQTQLISSLPLVEGITFLCAVLVFSFSVYTYRKIS